MRAATQAERFDHERDLRKHDWSPHILDQRFAVATLTGYCEGIINSGILGADGELALRQHVARALAAFDMPSIVEREPANV